MKNIEYCFADNQKPNQNCQIFFLKLFTNIIEKYINQYYMSSQNEQVKKAEGEHQKKKIKIIKATKIPTPLQHSNQQTNKNQINKKEIESLGVIIKEINWNQMQFVNPNNKQQKNRKSPPTQQIIYEPIGLNNQILANGQLYCPVCADQIYSSRVISMDNCKHNLHLQCILPYLQSKISQSKLTIVCPWNGCTSVLSQAFLRSTLSPADLEKYYRFSAFMYIQKHKKNQWIQCPQPDCQEIFIKRQTYNKTWYKCNTTQKKICLKCNKNYHPKFNDCNDYVKSLDPNSNQYKLLDMMQKNGWKQCPKCKHFVEKNQGCNHITCKCGNQFCYACEGPYPKCFCLKGTRN